MSISVNFYSFSKEPNSTSVVSSSASLSCDCVLREPTSVVNPSIRLALSTNPTAYNYAYISDFGRYYFITDWTSEQGRWVAHMTCDVLATYKSSITASSQYVMRSASEYDQYLSDNLYPCKTSLTYNNSSGTTTGANIFPSPDNYSFVVGIISPSATTDQFGGVTYYSMTQAELKALVTYMASTYTTWSGITEYSEAVQKALINPFQYIVSCHCLPVASTGTAQTTIKFGPYTATGCTGSILQRGTVASNIVSFNVAKHPLENQRKYLNCAPFSEYTLLFGPFGQIPIDPSILQDKSTLDVNLQIDYISGDGTLKILPGASTDGRMIRSCHIGVDVPMTAMVSNPVGAATGPLGILSSVGSVMNAMTNLPKYGADLINSVNDYGKAKMPQAEISGSQGSFVGWFLPVGLQAKFFDVAEFDDVHNGRLLMQTKTLSALSGFTVVLNPDVSISGTEDEADKIREFMSSGFYLE